MLLGFDFCGTHFFGEHPPPVKINSEFPMMIRSMAPMAADLAAERVQVLNCSQISQLTFWPKVRLETALAGEREIGD